MKAFEAAQDAWPEIDYASWRDTAVTLQMWTQMAGKVRLALSPWLNHGWQVPLYVNARGLGTSPIHLGRGMLQIDFDFVDHRLVICTSEGPYRGFHLEPMSVATFYRRFMKELEAAGVPVTISTMPSEVPEPIRFPADSALPDPYDGLVDKAEDHLDVHDCMGAALYIDQPLDLAPESLEVLQQHVECPDVPAAAFRHAVAAQIVRKARDVSRGKSAAELLIPADMFGEPVHDDDGRARRIRFPRPVMQAQPADALKVAVVFDDSRVTHRPLPTGDARTRFHSRASAACALRSRISRRSPPK